MARLQIAWTRRLTAQEVEENVKRHKALSSKRPQFVAGARPEGRSGISERQQDGQLFSWAAGPCMQKTEPPGSLTPAAAISGDGIARPANLAAAAPSASLLQACSS